MTDEAKTAAPTVEAAKDDPKVAEGPFTYEVDMLQRLERLLSGKADGYHGEKRKRATGHPAHEAHNTHSDLAHRAIGRAHAGLVQALDALSAFDAHDAKARETHAEATEKLSFVGDFAAGKGKFSTRQEAEEAWGKILASRQASKDAVARAEHKARLAAAEKAKAELEAKQAKEAAK